MALGRPSKPRGSESEWDIQLLVYADDVNSLEESIHVINRSTEALLESIKVADLQVNVQTTKYTFISREHNTGKTIT
jgi:hypothetical protein